MVVLWLYAGCRIAASRAKAVRKRRCGAHKTLRFANPLQARRAAVPIGGANALSAKDGVSVYGQARLQKCKKRLSQKDKSGAAGRNASVKGLRRPPQAGTAPFLRQAARKTPAACPILFTRKVFAGRLILRGPSYAQSKKTPDGRRGGGPAGRKSTGKNAQGRSSRPSGTASAGRTRRTSEIAASGGFSRAAAPIRRAAGPRVGQEKRTFSAPCGLSKKAHSPNPCAGAAFPAFCEKRIAKGTKPAPAVSEAGSASPKRACGGRSAPAGLPTAENPRRYLRLAVGPLVLQQLQRTFFVLVFLYFDYDCIQSPAHRAAEKTGRTIFS